VAGRVTLNGATIDSPAVNVGPDDRITVDGEVLPLRERTRLWLFHKPRGLVTTFRDPQGRPTVFEALPEEMPRVVAIGRLDINTEGLLLLTNDGGLAKVIAHPETGWTRRYRVRARGEVTQAELDKLRRGISVDEMDYGPVEATLDRVQGDNIWLSLALREGKNREVKRILEHLGLQVNRLIRLSFGPFQLGDLEAGLVDEVKTKVLRDQLGEALAKEAGVDFESPVREPIAPFGSEQQASGGSSRPARTPEPRRASAGDRPMSGFRGGPSRGVPARAFDGERRGDDRPPRPDRLARPQTAWRAEVGERPDGPKRHERREDPKADRAASAERRRERMPAIEGAEGKRVRVERVVLSPDQAPPARHTRDRPQPERGDAPRPARSFGPRAGKPAMRDDRRGGAPPKGGARPFSQQRPAGTAARPARPGLDGPGGPKSFKSGPPRGGRPGGGRPGGGHPGGGTRGRER